MGEKPGYNPEGEKKKRVTLFDNEVEPAAELSRSTYESLFAFKNFIEANQELIDERVEQGEDIDGVLYDVFYSADYSRASYEETDKNFLQLKKQYEQQVEKVMAYLSELFKQRQSIVPNFKSIKDGWVYYRVNGLLQSKQPIGRLYLNVAPQFLPQFYLDLVNNFLNSDSKIAIDTKISRIGSASDFNRSDKMVIYFNAADEKDVCDIVESLYKQQPQIFLPAEPRFTARLTDNQGTPMPGVSFGEEPVKEFGNSFGGVRSEILATLYQEYATEIKNHPSGTWNQLRYRFQTLCRERNINPQNAAFNLEVGEEKHFLLIKNKTKETI